MRRSSVQRLFFPSPSTTLRHRAQLTSRPRPQTCCHLLSDRSGAKPAPPPSSHLHRASVHRRFASLPSDDSPLASNGADGDSGAGDDSLRAKMRRLLKKTPAGRMSPADLRRARSFLFVASKWGSERGARLSEELLERIYLERDGSETTVDAAAYNAVMNAWNASGADGRSIARAVEGILLRMEERCAGATDDDHPARPDATTYNILLNSYSKSSDDSSHKVHATLDKMNALYRESRDREYATRVRPDEITYNSVMNYYASREDGHHSAQTAEDFLLRMSELSRNDEGARITSTSFNTVVKAWAKAGLGADGVRRATSLLDAMARLHDRGHDVAPTAITFSTVIDAHSGLRGEDAAEAVEGASRLLDRMEASPIPDAERAGGCYRAMANVYVAMGVEGAGGKVRELMSRMRNVDAVPDERMYAKCVEAYARGGEFDEAMGVLGEMTESSGDPSSAAFNTLLDALLKANTEESMGLAEDLFEKMEAIGGDSRPDVASYSMIIGALSRSSSEGSEKKAVDYLRSMLRSYNNYHYAKAKPNSFVFNCVIAMLDRCDEEWAEGVMYNTLMSMENQHRQGNTSVIPDTITYNTVIAKLSKRPTKENAKKVMRLMSKMGKKEEAGNLDAAPDIITYTNVLKIQEKLDPKRAAAQASWYLRRSLEKPSMPPLDRMGLRSLLMALSKSDRPEDALLALNTWKRLEDDDKNCKLLDSDTCNLVLLAHSKVKTHQSAEQVLSFLTKRLNRFSNGDKTAILPTVIGMNAALTVLASNGRMNDALSIIEIMKALSENGETKLQPDVGCYTSILAALTGFQSASKNNALYAEKVLSKAKEEFGQVPISVVNAAINACAWTAGDATAKRKAMETAVKIFEEHKEAQDCDAITFGLMIKASMKLASSEDTRFKLVQRLFQLCAKDGLVGSMVLREVGHFKKRLVPGGNVPPEWTVHANDK